MRPRVHDDDLVGDLDRLLLVVRDEDRRDVHLVVQPQQPLAQLLAHARVERAERLVEQQHLRLGRERARERHALPLAAGELRRIALAEPVELHELEQLVRRARAISAFGRSTDREPERDVVPHRHVLERRVVLEDEADAALLRRERRRLLAGDHDLAGVGRLEPRDHAQQRRLAAAARPEQRRQRAALDRDRDVVERHEVPEPLRDVTSSIATDSSLADRHEDERHDCEHGQREHGRSVRARLVEVLVRRLDVERAASACGPRCRPRRSLTAPNSPSERAVVSTTP